jgi:hypothetical protein
MLIGLSDGGGTALLDCERYRVKSKNEMKLSKPR